MSSFRPFNFIKDGYIADYANATTVYHGFYNPDPRTSLALDSALSTSTAQFLIAKETLSGTNTTKMEWAYTSGQPITYNQVWDNRASLTYR